MTGSRLLERPLDGTSRLPYTCPGWALPATDLPYLAGRGDHRWATRPTSAWAASFSRTGTSLSRHPRTRRSGLRARPHKSNPQRYPRPVCDTDPVFTVPDAFRCQPIGWTEAL